MKKLLTLALCLIWATTLLGQITIPNTLVPGATILSSGLNTNFSTLGTSALNRAGGTMTGTLVAQAITAGADASYDLGTSGVKFRAAFLSGALTAGSAVLTTALAISSGGTNGTATPTAGAVTYGTGSSYAFTAAGNSGDVLISQGASPPVWSGNAIPAGAILYFNATSCPSGWAEFTSARGAYIVGRVSGGTLNTLVGSALTNQENRNHTHTQTAGSTYRFGLATDGTLVASINSGGAWTFVATGGGGASPNGLEAAGATLASGNQSTTVAPYLQLLVCQKS